MSVAVDALGEQSCRRLVDAATGHAMFLLDGGGLIVSWNPGADLMTGFSAKDVIGRPASCLYPPEDVRAGKYGAVLHVAALRGKIQDDGWRLSTDGSRLWAEVVVTAIADSSGAVIGYAEVARDGTERMYLEQNLAAVCYTHLRAHETGRNLVCR